jgi:alkaline phosphatase
MQAAKAAGKRIGLVTTATVYDATPAAFALHAKSRRDSQALVDQLLALEPDVLMGGGREYFLPEQAGGKRKDGKDIIAAFRARGHHVARTPADLAGAGPKLLALFAEDDMEFEVDRDPAREPTTAEMAVAALKALEQQSPKGFVLLIENENIDTAGHRNDAASLMRALWAFDDAVKVALEFQRRHPETLVIVTGDHETGGFSPTYALKDLSSVSSSNRFYSGDEQLRMLERITMSFDAVNDKLGKSPTGEALDQLLAQHFPGFRLDPDLRAQILGGKTDERNFSYVPHNALGRMVARQTGYYWGTSGHTPEPVLVGAMGPGAELFRGYQDNTDFGRHLHRLIEGK